jgi:putative PIN family toxin of toxin-antitoxin system
VSVLVVLDTNVVVSAGISPAGPPARIVDGALAGAIIPVVCPVIAAEYIDVVNRPRFKKWNFPPVWLKTLIGAAQHVDQEISPWPISGPDPDDLIFLAVAHLTGAVLVTGNLADFPEHIRQGVIVMDPTSFAKHLDELGVRW